MGERPHDVVAVIGAGPAGLAAAATLQPLNFRVRVLEQSDSFAWRWRHHYDRLHLHTTRRLSALPGLKIPTECGRWVSRDDFVRYLESYVKRHAIAVELGTAVQRVERVAGGWHLSTSKGAVDADFVVVCAGYNNRAFTPDWPGRAGFAGELVHSQDYRNGEPYRGKRVLVVGTGNSGAEIATDLVEHGADVYWSFRTPPNILPRSIVGIPAQGLGIMLRPLPAKLVDPIVAAFERVTVGNLLPFGLPRPTRGMYSGVLNDHVLPILDVGVVAAIKSGRLRPVTAVASFDAACVLLVDQQRLDVDAVVSCTGFRPALETIVGHLGVLDASGTPLVHGIQQHPAAPGVFFFGYTNAISGNLREITTHARQLSRKLGAARNGARPARA